MVMHKDIWICEICRREYSSKEGADDCESHGLAPSYPIGLIFGNNNGSALYSKMVFCVESIDVDGHCGYISAWACRDNGYGDSLGDETCGGFPCRGLGEYYGNVDTAMPAFHRMVDFLKQRGITPTLWNGKEVVKI